MVRWKVLVDRFEKYFNDNQYLYLDFRDLYASMLPSAISITSGFITLQYYKLMNRGAIDTLIQNERDLLNLLQERVEIRIFQINELNETIKDMGSKVYVASTALQSWNRHLNHSISQIKAKNAVLNISGSVEEKLEILEAKRLAIIEIKQ